MGGESFSRMVRVCTDCAPIAAFEPPAAFCRVKTKSSLPSNSASSTSVMLIVWSLLLPAGKVRVCVA